MDHTLTNRRRFLSAAIAAGGAALPASVAVAAPMSSETSEVVSLFEGLNARRKDRVLSLLRDCHAAQRLFEQDGFPGR